VNENLKKIINNKEFLYALVTKNRSFSLRRGRFFLPKFAPKKFWVLILAEKKSPPLIEIKLVFGLSQKTNEMYTLPHKIS